MADSRTQEEQKTQICTFAEEYLYGLTTGSWSGKSNEEVYNETFEINEFNEEIIDRIGLLYNGCLRVNCLPSVKIV